MRIRWCAATLAGLAASGCWLVDVPRVAFYPENPFQEIRRFAIAPIFHMTPDRALLETDEGYPPMILGEMMASELVQFDGFEVIRPTVVASAIGSAEGWRPGSPEGPRIAQDALAALGADAIVVAAVTDFSPYDNPRIGVALQVFSSGRADRRAPDVGEIVQSGRPFPVGPGRQHGFLFGFEVLYDSNQRWVRSELGAFARVRTETGDRALDPEKIYTWDVENYLRFVLNRVLYRMVDEGGKLQDAWDHGVRE